MGWAGWALIRGWAPIKSSSQQDLPRKHVDSNFQKCFGFNPLKSPFLVVSETFRKDIGSSILRGLSLANKLDYFSGIPSIRSRMSQKKLAVLATIFFYLTMYGVLLLGGQK